MAQSVSVNFERARSSPPDCVVNEAASGKRVTNSVVRSLTALFRAAYCVLKLFVRRKASKTTASSSSSSSSSSHFISCCSSSRFQLTSSFMVHTEPFEDGSRPTCSKRYPLETVHRSFLLLRCSTTDIVEDCPVTRFPGGLPALHLTEGSCVFWLDTQSLG